MSVTVVEAVSGIPQGGGGESPTPAVQTIAVRAANFDVIPKGTIVRIYNALGLGIPTIALYEPSNFLNGDTPYFVTETFFNPFPGAVFSRGEITGLDTTGIPVGSKIYVDSTVPGAFTADATSNIPVGIVAAPGVVFFDFRTPRPRIDQCSDVFYLDTPTPGQVLAYSESGVWLPTTLPA
jgi:hypothetical protein